MVVVYRDKVFISQWQTFHCRANFTINIFTVVVLRNEVFNQWSRTRERIWSSNSHVAFSTHSVPTVPRSGLTSPILLNHTSGEWLILTKWHRVSLKSTRWWNYLQKIKSSVEPIIKYYTNSLLSNHRLLLLISLKSEF